MTIVDFKSRISTLKKSRGIALVTALIITLVVFMLIMSTIYMITSSTTKSGAGKRYATAQEAADGAVEVMKDSIGLVLLNTPVSSLTYLTVASGNLTTTIVEGGPANVSTVNIILPGTELTNYYKATVTIERLYSRALPGSRVEFARSGSGVGGTAVYFRISTVVTGPNNTKAETTALYRYVG